MPIDISGIKHNLVVVPQLVAEKQLEKLNRFPDILAFISRFNLMFQVMSKDKLDKKREKAIHGVTKTRFKEFSGLSGSLFIFDRQEDVTGYPIHKCPFMWIEDARADSFGELLHELYGVKGYSAIRFFKPSNVPETKQLTLKRSLHRFILKTY